jgi:thiol peroxidase
MPSIQFHGESYNLIGKSPEVGDAMPEFSLTGGRARDPNVIDTSEVLSWGKPVLISVVTSVDTPVGSLQAKIFQKRLSDSPLADSVCGILVTSDLPFTINRFCRAEDIDNLVGGSDYLGKSFGRNWGLLIEGYEVLARAVFVVDAAGVVRYRELVPDITSEPNYEAALNTLFGLV